MQTTKKRAQSILGLATFLALMIGSIGALAQPGPGGPGGFGGGHGDRPPRGERPFGMGPNGPRDNMQPNQKAQTVKKKKAVTGSTFKVVGELRDSATSEALPFVNVSVLDSVDSTFVKGGSTNFDGYFEVTQIPQGGYLLRIAAIGYESKMVRFHVWNNTALGTISMQSGATTLREVVITDSKPLYAMDGEKTIYNVSEDPTIQSGTTTDALQNAPGVEVDIEGNITLRGVSNVEIWINDKPSNLTEDNLKAYLETLPANALDRIEAITNPSAKYATDAEAVINIVTSAHIKSSQFLSIGLNASSQPNLRPNISYVWANERLTINTFASFNYSFRENESESNSVSRRDGSTKDSYDTVSTSHRTSESDSRRYRAMLGANINYIVDSMTDVGAHFHANYNGGRSYSSSNEDYKYILDPTHDYTFANNDTSKNGSWGGNFGADYTHKFNNEGHNIRIMANANVNDGMSDESLLRDYTTTYTLLSDEDKYYKDFNHSRNFMLMGRYNLPYSENGELSFGLGGNYGSSESEFRRLEKDTIKGDYSITDPLRAYSYKGSNCRTNADVNWTRRWGGFTLELGFGGRYDHIDFNYINEKTPDDTSYNFLTYNPSIHLSYRTEDLHNFKLNYSLRMSNPSEGQLTTFKRYGEDSYSIGNRNLKAYYTHSLEAGWTKYFSRFGSVGIDGYGRYSTNEISSLSEATDVEDEYLKRIIQYSTPYNMGSSYRYGATLNLTYRPSGFINVRFYANVYDYGYRMDRGARGILEESKWSYSFRLNCWAKVFEKYQVYGNFRYTSPTLSLASQTKERYSLDLGVRADFFKRKLSAFISVQDIFNWGVRLGTGSKNTNPYYLTDATQKVINSRFISAGITLRFGKMELEKKASDGGSDSDGDE